jgi:hypothetical protein
LPSGLTDGEKKDRPLLERRCWNYEPKGVSRFHHACQVLSSSSLITITPNNRHGEVFVLDDGGEVDLDLGNYERYLNITLTRENNITTGKIYQQVIERERRGDYLGRTVQVVPHITDAIQDWIERVAAIPVDETNSRPDVCIIEVSCASFQLLDLPC